MSESLKRTSELCTVHLVTSPRPRQPTSILNLFLDFPSLEDFTAFCWLASVFLWEFTERLNIYGLRKDPVPLSNYDSCKFTEGPCIYGLRKVIEPLNKYGLHM